MSNFTEKWQENLETGIKYLGEGNAVEAEKYLQESLKNAEGLGVPIILAFSQRLLATAQVKNNKLDEAEEGFKKALGYCLKLENKKGIAEAKAGLANIYFVKEQYDQATHFYQQAIDIYPLDSSALRLAVMQTDLGHVYLKLKKWDKAEQAFQKALKICKGLGYGKGEAEIGLYLGEVYYSQGKHHAAEGMLFESAKYFGREQDELALANAHQYLAFICMETNRIDEALFYQYRVIPLYLKYQLRLEVSEGYCLLSYILQSAGLLDEAEKSLMLSLDYYNGNEFGFAVRYQSMAVIAIKKLEYERAKKYYFEALKFFQFYGLGTKIGEISQELTYLLKYEDEFIKENLYHWLNGRYADPKMTDYDLMLNLAHSLQDKGNNIGALHCGWRALKIARNMEYETGQAETFIQNLSQSIRKRK